MIISASRRTDIPAFYADWLINRIGAGYCLVKNPFNPEQIRRVSLIPEDVDGIVLWTKNAAPLLPKLPVLESYSYYFQYTVTPYHIDMESGLADKKTIVIPAFIELAKQSGAERVIWRYDPIIVTAKYDFAYHVRAFTKLCELLSGSTKKCVISFVIGYKSAKKNLQEIGHRALVLSEKLELAETFLNIAKAHGIALCACCEASELYEIGIQPIACVDPKMFGVDLPCDKNQRKGCNCAVSVDIGAYNSCMNGCRYCYANHSPAKVRTNYAKHDAGGDFQC